jgi:iron complex outermembrane recepter protein
LPLRLIVSYNQQDVAPTLQQLDGSAIITPNVRIFDFVRGSDAVVNRINGGNDALNPATRHVFKAGLTLRLSSSKDLTFTTNYTSNDIATLSASTPIFQAAFPDRFTRDAGGTLLRLDSRPVNFDQNMREDIRWGVNFSMPLKSPTPSPEVMAKFRALFTPPGSTGPNPAATPERPAGGQAGGANQGPGGGRGGGGFGGGGARLQLAVYHNLRLRDDLQVRAGLPLIDLLDGGTIGGNTGGQPQHEIEFQGGVSRLGLGARLSVNWQSGTQVNSLAPGVGTLRYSDLTTLNLRLFVNPTGRPSWVVKYPWLRGTRLTVSIDNLLNDRISVTNTAGLTPGNLQPALLDPLGRTVRISLRKLFF